MNFGSFVLAVTRMSHFLKKLPCQSSAKGNRRPQRMYLVEYGIEYRTPDIENGHCEIRLRIDVSHGYYRPNFF